MARTYGLTVNGELVIGGLERETLAEAYEYAKAISAMLQEDLSVWRKCIGDPNKWAMVGSVYRDGRVVGIKDNDVWGNAFCDLG